MYLFEKAISERIRFNDCNRCDRRRFAMRVPAKLVGTVEILTRVFSIQSLQLLIIQEPREEVTTEDIEGQDLLAFKEPHPRSSIKKR